MSEKQNEAFANFVAITGASEERAKFYMESSDWNLDVSEVHLIRFQLFLSVIRKFILQAALVNFYDGETSEESSSREDRPTVSQQPSNAAPKKPEKKSVIKSTGK